MKFEWKFMFWVKFLFKKLPWVIIIAVFGFLTAKSSSTIFLEFINGERSTTVTSIFAKNITLPQSTLSIDLLTDELYKSTLEAAALSNTYYEDFVSSGIECDMFLTENLLHTNWSRTLLYIAHHYLACISSYEFFEDKTACFKNETSSGLFEACYALENQLQINNVTTDELRQKFGREIAAAYSLSVTKQSALQSITSLDLLTTNVNLDQICYRMRFDLHPFQRGINDAFVIEVTSPLTNWSFDYVKSMDLYYYGIYVDLSGRADFKYHSVDYGTVVFWARFSEHQRFVPISVTSIFQALPQEKGTVRCSENQSLDACKAACKETYIREVCKCTSTVKNYPSMENSMGEENYTECDLEQFVNCWKGENLYNHSCEENCLTPCQTTSFAIEIIQPKFNIEKKNGTKVELTIASFDYAMFNETYKWKMESFLAEFGGALGLWLGISFIHILQFMTTILLFSTRNSTIFKEKIENRNCVDKQNNTITKTSKRNRTIVQPRTTIQVRELSAKFDDSGDQTSVSNSHTRWCAKPKKLLQAIVLKLSIKTNENKWTRQRIIKSTLRIAVLITFGTLSLKYCILFCEEYAKKPISSSFEIMVSNSISLPNASVCLPLFIGELDGTPRENNATLGNITSAENHHETIIDYFNLKNMSKALFLNETWPNSLLHVIHTYLAMLSFCETFDGNGIIVCSDDELHTNYDPEIPPWGIDYLAPTRKLLEKNLQAMNISASELRQSFGSQVAILFSFSVGHYWNNGHNGTALATTPLFVGKQEICYEVGIDSQSLTLASSIDIYAEKKSLPWPFVHANTEVVTFDLQKRYGSNSNRFGQLARGYFHYKTLFTLEVLSSFQALSNVNGVARCSDSISFEDCTAKCRADLIKNLCNCSATTWPTLASSSTKECDLQIYQSCLTFSGTHDSSCTSNCLGLCARSNYKFYHSSYYTTSSYTTPTIQLHNLNFPIFEESLKYQFNDLICAIGGIIGLFLGLDIHGILHSIHNFVLIVFAKYRQERKKRISASDQDAVIEMVEPNQILGPESEEQRSKLSNKDYLKLIWQKIYRWCASKIIPLFILLSLSYLTLQVVNDLIQQYHTDKTVPNMNLLFRQNISLPKSTICLDLYFGDLDETKAPSFGNRTDTYYQENLNSYFRKPEPSKEMFLIGEMWPNALLNVAHAYLQFMTDNEGYITNFDLIDRFYTGTFSFLSSPRNSDDLYLAITLLEENMQKLNVTSNDLRQKFGREVNRLITLQAIQISIMANATVTYQEIPINYTTSVGYWGICYQAPFDKYPFHKELNQRLRISTADISTTLPYASKSFLTFQIDFSDGNMTGIELNLYDDKDAITYSHTAPYEHLQVESVFRALPTVVNGKARCSETITQEGCMAQCRVNLIEKLCNCSATSWSYLIPSDVRECRANDYFTCLEYSSTEDVNCMNECVDLCEHWKFLSIDTFWNPPSHWHGGGIIELQMVNFDYISFAEQSAWTFDTISASMGNALNSYLGLDFFTVVFFIVEKTTLLFAVIFG